MEGAILSFTGVPALSNTPHSHAIFEICNMETTRSGHLDIDTRPCPTVSDSFYKTASNDPFNVPAVDLFGSVIASEKVSQKMKITSDMVLATASIIVAPFQTMRPSASTPSVLSTITAKAMPQPTLAVGEVFAIVLSSITALVPPIVLLIRCLKRSRRRKRETRKHAAILKDVMSSRAVGEDAWKLDKDYARAE